MLNIMKSFIFIALLLPLQVLAYPYLVSDTTKQAVTDCGIVIDSAEKIEVPVEVNAVGDKYCSYDLVSISVGSHTVTATFINNDPLWGRAESVDSPPFTFVRPDNVLGAEPTNIRIIK